MILPKISILIATYNQPQYILQAVQSALFQTYSNVEVVVSDDSDNDETEQLLGSFIINNEIRYYRNSENIGRVKNYRKLLYEYATGDWVVMLDGDDYYIDNNYLSNAVSWIKQNEKVVLIASGHILDNINDNTKTELYLTSQDHIFNGKDVFTKGLKLGQHSTNVYNCELAKKINFYSNDSLGADSEGLFKLCLHGDVVYLEGIVVAWRIHKENYTYSSNIVLKQMRELNYIDNVYLYAINFIDKSVALQWKKNMFFSMSYHIINLAESTNNFGTKLKTIIWASKYWKLTNTFRYLKRITWKQITQTN